MTKTVVHVDGEATGRACRIFQPFPGCPYSLSRRHSWGGADPEADPSSEADWLCGLGPLSWPLSFLGQEGWPWLPSASAWCDSEHLAGGRPRSPEGGVLPALS